MSFVKAFILALTWVVSAQSMAQTSLAAASANHEQIDVANFFNGGYPYTPYKYDDTDKRFNQLRAISHGRTVNAFHRDDLKKRDGNQELNLFYSFATSATIESFRISGEDKDRYLTPARIEFALSQSPVANFQTVATFDVPEPYLAAKRTRYDFSIPLKQKVSARYVRITLSGSKYGRYRLSRFSAYGQFDQPVELRTDFSGIYHMYGDSRQKSPANYVMMNQQTGTGYDPYLILHQKDGQISGCYIYGSSNSAVKGVFSPREISEVLGTITGGVENNVFRFTRTHAKDGSESQGAMAFAPVAEGITKSSWVGYFLISKDPQADIKEGDGAFRASLTRSSSTPPPCAITGQREKTAAEAMQERLEKTGKVQLYGVNFDFDSDVLRPESSAVLDEVVNLAKANPGWKFEIGGHTDSFGSADYNLKLSDRRAASVMRYLTGKGVEPARLKAKGYGATRPLIANADNEADHAQNRRVELVKLATPKALKKD